MFLNRSSLNPLGCSLLKFLSGALLALATGCGAGNGAGPSVSGATVGPRIADMPACGASVTVAQAVGIPVSQYYLAPGATDRERLFLAILRDDAAGLSAYLAAGANVNSAHGRSYSIAKDGQITFADDSQSEQVSLLHWASETSVSGETIRLLISAGADVRSKDSMGVTPLMEAAGNPYLSLAGLQALLTAGASVRDRDNSQKDPLLYAASIENTDHGVLCLMSAKVQALIGAGSDINENMTYTPVMTALFARNLGMAKLARALGGDLRARAKQDGSSALHMVARAHDDSIGTVEWLLSRGIDLRVLDFEHKTALELFKENLSNGSCHTVDPSHPKTDLCAAGTAAIIKAIEKKHRR